MGKCLQTAPHNSDSDISPVRRTAPVRRQAAPVRNDSDSDISPVRRTSSARTTSGQRAGIVSGADIKVETAET